MNIQSQRFLLPMWEGGGTVPPGLGVARRLVARGHAVHVLADPTIGDLAEGAGCSFSPWRRAPHRTSLDPSGDLIKDWETSNPVAMLRRVRDRFLAGPAADYAADTADAIEAFRPTAVAPDYMLFGAIIAAQAAGLPVAPIVPNIWMIPTRGTPAIGPGFQPARTAFGRGRDAAMHAVVNRLFDRGLPTLNAARADYGLEPLTSFYDQVLGTDRILMLTSATFDFASSTVPSHAQYVGPVLDEPAWAEPWESPWADASDGDDPLVLVALSSTYQEQGPLLRRIVAALTPLPVRAVVTLGQMLDPDEVEPSPNVEVIRSAPHGPILERASLLVTHCGHGTTIKALAAGVPMVCIPMGRDQNDTAARVLHSGAGVRLKPSASQARIGKTVMRVLGDNTYRSAAARLAAALADERRDAAVAEALEAIARGGPSSDV